MKSALRNPADLLDRGLTLLRKVAPIALLVTSAAFLYILIRIEFWSIVGPILGAAGGAVIAVGLSIVGFFRSKRRRAERAPDPLDVRIPVILTCLYVASIIILFRFNTYHRPPLVYAIFGGYVGAIGYQIARGERRSRVLPQILVLSFFIYWSSQFLFPAGMYSPDTVYRYLPAIRSISLEHQIPASEARYAGHLAYVSAFALTSGLPPQIAYFLLATIVLSGTALLLGTLNSSFPVLPSRVSLYAALVFSVMSWMIGRGMRPNKLNFFYPMILLLGIVAFRLYQADSITRSNQRGWVWIGLVVSPAIVFGHRFSAGAALVFLLVFGIFVGLSRSVLVEEYPRIPQGVVVPFILVYVLQVVGNPLHKTALLGRLADLFVSLVVPSTSAYATAGGGPGRYSELPLQVLAVSTAAQTFLFTLAVIGGIQMFRESEWEYDFAIFWICCVSILLVVSLLQNSADTSPQRFYSLLGLFGFNVCVGVLLHRVNARSALRSDRLSFDAGPTFVAVLLATLAVTSLASPVADKATSPVSDEIPHFRQFDTYQLEAGNQWSKQYAGPGLLEAVPPTSEVPLRKTDRVSAVIKTDDIAPGTTYLYSELAMRTGLQTGGGLTIGGRNYVFVASPSVPRDGKIYTNGQTTGYLRQ